MFNGDRYITKGVQDKVSIDLQLVLWSMIEELERKGVELDYLQVFHLSGEVRNNQSIQIIEHSQEIPKYETKLELIADNPIQAKIFVISDEDENSREYSTMLLAEEY